MAETYHGFENGGWRFKPNSSFPCKNSLIEFLRSARSGQISLIWVILTHRLQFGCVDAILHRQCLSSSVRYTTMHRCSFGPDLVYVTITLTWCIILCWVIVIIRWYGLSVADLDNAQFVTSFLSYLLVNDPRGNYMQTYLKKRKIWDQVLLERSSMDTLNSEYKPQNINLDMRNSEQPNLDLVVTW